MRLTLVVGHVPVAAGEARAVTYQASTGPFLRLLGEFETLPGLERVPALRAPHRIPKRPAALSEGTDPSYYPSVPRLPLTLLASDGEVLPTSLIAIAWTDRKPGSFRVWAMVDDAGAAVRSPLPPIDIDDFEEEAHGT